MDKSSSRYWSLQGEGDFIVWRLETIRQELHKPRAPIDIMIDEASGYWGEKTKEVKKLIKRFKKIKQLMGISATAI